MTHPTQLAAKVAARNNVNRLALEMVPRMVDALKPLVGKVVLNQGAVISAKLYKALPEREHSPQRSWYYSGSKYSLTVCFKTCEQYAGRYAGDYCCACYAEQWATLAEIENHAIKALVNGQTFRTDYTVEEILAARKEVEAAQAALDAAESKLCGFGKFDN